MVGTGHKRQALIGNLLGLYRGSPAGDGTGVRGPADAGKDCFLCHIQAALVIAVESGIDLVGCVAHIRAPFPFGTIHIGVTHTDRNRVQAFLPELIQFFIFRRKRPDPFAVKFTFAVTQCCEFHTGLCFDIKL